MRVRKRALTFIILSIIAITYIIRVVVVNKDAERTTCCYFIMLEK